jgi:hypothetical protein
MMTDLKTFCLPFPQGHIYAGAYIMVRAASGEAALAAARIGHGQQCVFQVFTEYAFFETRDRWHMHRMAVLEQTGAEDFRLVKTWGVS